MSSHIKLNLLNAQQMNKEHPKTFEVPSDKELRKIKVGDIVKICDDDAGERFWVEIKAIETNSGKLIGSIANNLIRSKANANDKVLFERENVLSIWEDQRKC